MRVLPIALSCLGLAATASCGTPGSMPMASAAADTKQCFHQSDVRTFSDAGPNKVLVSVGRQEVWELTVSPGCPRIDFTSRLALVARGSSYICNGADIELIVPSASGRSSQSCLVREVRKYTPEEAAAVRS